jgi:hypothetical protein
MDLSQIWAYIRYLLIEKLKDNNCTRKGKFCALDQIFFQVSFHVKQVHHLVAQHYSVLPLTPSLTHHHEAAVMLLEFSIQHASHAFVLERTQAIHSGLCLVAAKVRIVCAELAGVSEASFS